MPSLTGDIPANVYRQTQPLAGACLVDKTRILRAGLPKDLSKMDIP